MTIEARDSYELERATAFRALIERLGAESGIPAVTAAELASCAARTPLLAVLFTGDPTRSPESWDACVVLPELLRACRLADEGTAVAAVILDPAASRDAAPAYGVDRLPALVVLRDGEYTGVIEGMQDWPRYLAELGRLAVAPARRPPVSGVYTVSTPGEQA